MALSAHVGSFNITTQAAGNTVQVTGTGFQPKVILFWWNGRTDSTDGVGGANHYRGIGWTTSATNRATCLTRSNTSSSNGSTFCDTRTTSCIADDPASATPGEADLQSFDSNGFTLVIDVAFAVNLRVHYLALGGSTLTDVASGTFTPTGVAPATQDVTSLSFQPDLVFFLTTEIQQAADTGGAIDSVLSFGVANASISQVWAGGSQNGSAAMQTMSYCADFECIARYNTGVSQLNDIAEFTTFLSNGFRINWLQRNGAGTVAFLALKGASGVVGSLLTRTDTTTPIQESGFGFTPSAVLFVSACRTESVSDVPTDHDQWSMGAASSTAARNVAATLDEDALVDSDVTTASEFDAVYANIATDSTIQGLMDVQSFDSDGFTCIMDDADPAQNYVWYVALGPAEAAAGRRFVLH